MITVKFDLSKFSEAKVRKLIGDKVAEVTERVALKTYNYLVGFADWPYWSGSYISSWKIGIGSPDRSFNAPATRTTNGPSVTYSVPDIEFHLPNKNQPYQKIYISNSTPHAFKVEYEGTKSNDYHPWLTATVARNNTVQTFKFF